MNRKVAYSIPSIGNIKIDLYGKASELYDLFDKKSEIERLRMLSQLGLLEKVFQGAHHTRWEYIILQFYLLNKFKADFPGFGLSSDIKKPFGLDHNFTAIESIQMFILLQNYGHLYGTFETECLVLETLSAHTQIKNRFISLLPVGFKSWGKKIIENQQKLQFYKVLSVLFVANSKDFNNDKALKELCLKVLKGFYLSNSDRLQSLNAKVKLIRNVSYVFLDLNYVSVGFNITLSSILLSTRDFFKKVLSQDSRFYKFIHNLQDYLSEAVYFSPDACWCLLEARNKIGSKITRKLQGFTRSNKQWFEYMKGLKKAVPAFNAGHRPPFFILQMPGHPLSRTFNISKPISYIKELCEKNDIETTYMSGINPNLPQKAFFFFSSMDEHILAKSFYGLISALCSNKERTIKPFLRMRELNKFLEFKWFQGSFDSIFKSFLYILTAEKFDIYIEPTPLKISSIACMNKAEAKQQFNALIYEIKSSLNRSRNNEMECLKYILNRVIFGGRIGVCFSNIKFLYRKKHEGENRRRVEAGELDGIILESNKLGTKFHIIEAKKQKSGGVSAAVKKLKSLMSKLEISSQMKNLIQGPFEIPQKGAYLTVTFKTKRRTGDR